MSFSSHEGKEFIQDFICHCEVWSDFDNMLRVLLFIIYDYFLPAID